MSPLTQAISQGFSAEQILQYLLRQSPQYSKQIKKALSQGFSASEVVKYLGGGRKGVNENDSALTENEKTRKSDYDKQKNLENNIGKGALAVGGAALGAYGLSRAGQSIIPPVLPQSQELFNPKEGVEINVTPRIAQQTKQIEFQPPHETIQQAKQPDVPPTSSPIVQPPPQSQPIQQPTINFGDVLENIGLKYKVDALREQNPPDVISKVLKYGMRKDQIKEIESRLGAPIDDFVNGYLQSAPPVETMQEKVSKGVPFGNKEKEQGSTVILPDGSVGIVDSIKQGIAAVNSEGKIRRKKLDDLIESPLPEKDLSDLYRDVISGVEKETGQDVSRMVSWAGYDPRTNELAFVPHEGGLYTYDNISEEDVKELTNILSQRKTSGENFIGAWTQSSNSPIGASMSKLIQKLQKERGGKGSEYKGKYEKIYDALEPAKLALKRKYKEEQEEKRRKRKNEKKQTQKPGSR